jgi:hypothetical protein
LAGLLNGVELTCAFIVPEETRPALNESEAHLIERVRRVVQR